MWKKISCFSLLYHYPYTKQPRFQRGYVKLHKGGARVWVRVEMCHAFQLPLCNNVAMARSLVACCSRFLLWKDLRRNLDYHLCQVRNMWTKYFYYFQGLRGLKCYRTKSSNRVNYRSKWPLWKTFSSSTPPPAWISRVFDTPSPPPARISRILSVAGVWISFGTTR